MIVEINALDTLFFRDGKPFTMGEDTWTDSVFPPYPSVIYGALRSIYFSEHIDELEKAGNDNDPTKSLKIKSICYGIGSDVYFPLPSDCVKGKEDDDESVKVSVLPMEKNEVFSNCPAGYILFDKTREVENIEGGLARKSMLEKYLILQAPEKFSIQQIKDYIMSEPKIGIGKSNDTHSTEEGKLYRVDMKRLENKKSERFSIIVDFEGLNLPNKGIMKIGGEGKTVRYEEYEENISIDTPKFEYNENIFKIYLSTPAIFKNGWLPEWIDGKTLKGSYNGLKLKLLTAAIGKPIRIGGFDVKARRPKPMFKAVPAGSVYYFEIVEGDIEKVISLFHQKAISDVDSEYMYPEQGFGIAYVGRVKSE